MLILREARRIASRWLDDISGCTEYTNAYMFFNPRSENAIGGFDMPVFVLKQNGRLMSTMEYCETMAGEAIRTIHF